MVKYKESDGLLVFHHLTCLVSNYKWLFDPRISNAGIYCY